MIRLKLWLIQNLGLHQDLLIWTIPHKSPTWEVFKLRRVHCTKIMHLPCTFTYFDYCQTRLAAACALYAECTNGWYALCSNWWLQLVHEVQHTNVQILQLVHEVQHTNVQIDFTNKKRWQNVIILCALFTV